MLLRSLLVSRLVLLQEEDATEAEGQANNDVGDGNSV